MIVHVKLFAYARQLAGRAEVDVMIAGAATVAGLRAALAEQVPELAGILTQVMFAVGTEYADDSATIQSGADVACILPVSGG